MALSLRYGASVKDFTQKVKQELKGTKYANLLSDNASILIIGMTKVWLEQPSRIKDQVPRLRWLKT